MNITFQLGNLTRDPELKYLPNGTAICSIGIAVNEVWKDQSGDKQERVHFFDCEAWGKTGENIAKFFTKGKPILIEGSLAMDSWDDKATGQKRSKVKIKVNNWHFCGGDSKQRSESSERPASQRKAVDPDDDDQQIPF